MDRLGAEYCALGHEVYLVVPGPVVSRARLTSGVTRIALPALRIPFTGGYHAVLPRSVTAQLAELKPDALEVSDRLTLRSLGSWGRRRGVGTVMISHERLDRLAGQVMPRRAARAIADVANRRTAADYDAVVCTTAFAREEFDRIGAANVVTVPLGVDLEQFHPRRRSARVRRRWATPGQTLLVHCGRLSVEKHAHQRSKPLSLFVLRVSMCGSSSSATVRSGSGSTPSRPPARRLHRVRRLPGHGGVDPGVRRRGWHRDRETFGLAALEALACGTPAVASRTSALAEILTAGCGAAADNDPGAIAAAVAALISRPESARRDGARRRAEQFSWPRSASGMLDALGV